MHGYFLSLKLYDAARVIANPFVYAEHREKTIREKMEKMAETRIRTKKDVGVKVNKALADKILRDEERARKRAERKRLSVAEQGGTGDIVHGEGDEVPENNGGKTKPSLLNDPRFARLFEDPEFAVDAETREYALMNPSTVAQRSGKGRTKTAVEEEEDESDKASSDGLQESEGDSEEDDGGSDSSDAGGEPIHLLPYNKPFANFLLLLPELNKFDPRARPGQKNQRAQEAYTRNRQRNRVANVNLVPLRAQTERSRDLHASNRNMPFGQRRNHGPKQGKFAGSEFADGNTADGGVEISWVPPRTNSAGDGDKSTQGIKDKKRRQGLETFGLGLEKGGESQPVEISERERQGRTQRRKGIRSGSRKALRRV